MKKAYEDTAWLMKPSEIEVDEIVAIVKTVHRDHAWKQMEHMSGNTHVTSKATL